MTTTERVRKILIDKLDISEEQVVPNATITGDLKADSLDKMDIMMGLQEEFDINIPDNDVDQINTVQQIVDYIDTRLNA